MEYYLVGLEWYLDKAAVLQEVLSQLWFVELVRLLDHYGIIKNTPKPTRSAPVSQFLGSSWALHQSAIATIMLYNKLLQSRWLKTVMIYSVIFVGWPGQLHEAVLVISAGLTLRSVDQLI